MSEQRTFEIVGEIALLISLIGGILAVLAYLKYYPGWRDRRATRRHAEAALINAAPAITVLATHSDSLVRLATIVDGAPADPLMGREHPVPGLGERLLSLEDGQNELRRGMDTVRRQITERNGGSHLRDRIEDTAKAAEAAATDAREAKQVVNALAETVKNHGATLDGLGAQYTRDHPADRP